jgi:hypothetical protein
MDTFMSRILPVVGTTFTTKRVAFFGVHHTALVMDAFARCGTRRQDIMDGSIISEGDNIAPHLGSEFVGSPAAVAMSSFLQKHQEGEGAWDLSLGMTTTDALKGSLDGVDFVIGGGTLAELITLEGAADQMDVEGVFFTILDGVPVSSAVFLKRNGDLPVRRFLDASGKTSEQLDGNDLVKRRIDWLDASDLAMTIAKANLLQDTSYACDLSMVDEGRSLILRGTPSWPWTVIPLAPDDPRIEGLMAKKYVHVPHPVSLLRDGRVLLIGLGTGSLFAGEAVNFFNHLCLVDCKEYSPFNPVRQLPGTASVGHPKASFLQRLLAHRINHHDDEWKEEIEGSTGLSTLSWGERTLSAVDLAVDDSDEARGKLEKVIDAFRPTIAVVAMGQTQGENFVACEILKKRGIPTAVPSAFPSATHYQIIVLEHKEGGPCYECVHQKLPVDHGPGPALSAEQREMFYGGTQPATIFETWPSSHVLLRSVVELALPPAVRSSWFSRLLAEERISLVGCNIAQQTDGNFLYGCVLPGQVVSYGIPDIVGRDDIDVCSCGRRNTVTIRLED